MLAENATIGMMRTHGKSPAAYAQIDTTIVNKHTRNRPSPMASWFLRAGHSFNSRFSSSSIARRTAKTFSALGGAGSAELASRDIR